MVKDNRGKEFGRKSTLLEVIGVLLPLACFLERIAGKSLVFWVDNDAVVYGWANGYIKFDSTASYLLKCIHVLSSYMGTRVTVKHILRMSNNMASLADELSRRSYSEDNAAQLALVSAARDTVFKSQLDWISIPTDSTAFLPALVSEAKMRLNLL